MWRALFDRPLNKWWILAKYNEFLFFRELTFFFVDSPWIHYFFFANSLRIHYLFMNSLFYFLFRELTIFFANSLWIHYEFFMFNVNSPWIHHLYPKLLWIHYFSRESAINPQLIHNLFCKFTKNSLSFLWYHYNLTFGFANSLCFHE